MPTDLPERIRDALHADEVGAAELRQPTMRGSAPAGRRTTRVLAVVGAAAVVAAITIVVSLVATSHRDDRAAGQPDAMAGISGYRWDVTSLRDAQGTLTVPRASRARIGFSRTGVVLGNDGVNTVAGRYEATATGYRVTTSATTAVGAVGDDPVRDRVVAAVETMLAPTGSPGVIAPDRYTITVTLSGDTLTLRRGGTALTLARAGAQPDAEFAQPDAELTSAPRQSPSPDAAVCTDGQTQRGFTLSIASGAHGAESAEAALKYFLDHNTDLGFGASASRAWTVRHVSTNAATATSHHPDAMIKLVQLAGKGWFAESGYTCP